jgi:hypothetical protein
MQDGVDNSLNAKQEACLSNCVDRFVDSAIILTSRFNSRISK